MYFIFEMGGGGGGGRGGGEKKKKGKEAEYPSKTFRDKDLRTLGKACS